MNCSKSEPQLVIGSKRGISGSSSFRGILIFDSAPLPRNATKQAPAPKIKMINTEQSASNRGHGLRGRESSGVSSKCCTWLMLPAKWPEIALKRKCLALLRYSRNRHCTSTHRVVDGVSGTDLLQT